jgi:hypothetical protein
MEEQIMKRLDEITSEFAQLKQLDHFDLTLEPIGDNGDVNVTLKRGTVTFERLIGYREPLEWISDTFYYPDTFTPQSKDIATTGLQGAYFGKWGDLIIQRDGTQEILRVKDAQRDEVTAILKAKLGKKFGKPTKVVPKPVKNAPKIVQESMYKVYFTIDGKTDYFIIAGDSLERIRSTALDVIMKRGLNYEKNNIHSEKINN